MSADVIDFHVPRRSRYPRSEGTARPYRLWNALERKAVPYRYYSDPKRAHMGALFECRWSRHVGTTIEVYNATNGRLLGQYTLRVNTIEFRKGD